MRNEEWAFSLIGALAPQSSGSNQMNQRRTVYTLCVYLLLQKESHYWLCEVWFRCRIQHSGFWSGSPNSSCGTKAFQRIRQLEQQPPSYNNQWVLFIGPKDPSSSFMTLQLCIYRKGFIFGQSFVFYFSPRKPHCMSLSFLLSARYAIPIDIKPASTVSSGTIASRHSKTFLPYFVLFIYLLIFLKRINCTHAQHKYAWTTTRNRP